MDGISLELPLFIVATFAGALVAGLSGFAFGLVAASIWLYILTPLQSASLIIAFGLIVQGYSVWKLRGALGLMSNAGHKVSFSRLDRPSFASSLRPLLNQEGAGKAGCRLAPMSPLCACSASKKCTAADR
ncbi:hypothetical protein AC629_10750 [Bradyrhizobium sp. NAS80.1]|uniref:hypothetical protein n=1 Tax=Bradyrhizobium sp. NAS80.1 TaxID=1680159 RepID=UPI00095E94D7|nr:hypothetical protein [Bradyrhizobium sp. NAS80.1]OKO88203.1 hypothetical protein AC629_10750 [Bradyrhizobium sp. NAS80.1]